MEILKTKERKMNKKQRKEREYLHTFRILPAKISLFTLYFALSILEPSTLEQSSHFYYEIFLLYFCIFARFC